MSPPGNEHGAMCLPSWAGKWLDAGMIVLIGSLAAAGIAAAVYRAWPAVPVGITGAGLLSYSWVQVRRSCVGPVRKGIVRPVVGPPPRWLIAAMRITATAVGLAGLALVIGGVWFAAFAARRSDLLMVVGSGAGMLGVLMIRAALSVCEQWTRENVIQILGAAFFLPSLWVVCLTANAFPVELWPLRTWAIIVALVCRRAFYLVAFAVCLRLFPAGQTES